MKKTILLITLTICTGSLWAQKKTTTSAVISFDATTPKDGLPKAENKTAIGSVDTKTGVVAFEAAVKNFSFFNPKMQEHFNGTSWMNSDQYPLFSFSGKIEKISKLKLTKEGKYTLKVNGDLKIKDISRKINTEAVFTVTNGKLRVVSAFSINLSDYNITGQPVESGKVSKEPKITVSAEF